MTITVEHLTVLPSPLEEQCYDLYAEVFADINQLAAQRHLLTGDEFYDVALDDRITKLVARDGTGELVGIGAVTNVLEAHPLVSAPYYARLFPDHYGRKALWYVMFVGVRPRAPHVFRAIVERLYALTMSVGGDGVALMDFCSFNEEARKLPEATEKMLSRWDPNTERVRLDAQTTWGYRFDGGGHPVPGRLV